MTLSFGTSTPTHALALAGAALVLATGVATAKAEETGAAPVEASPEALIARAEGGDVEAQLRLGAAYEAGRFARRDSIRAYAWYAVAAANGSAAAAEAQQRIAGRMNAGQLDAGERRARKLIVAHGGAAQGVSVDPPEPDAQNEPTSDAERFASTREQALLGSVAAQATLGAMYESGTGIPQNYVQAHSWYNIASANGHEGAAASRDALAERMTAEQLAAAQQLASETFPTSQKKTLAKGEPEPSPRPASEPPVPPKEEEEDDDGIRRLGPYLGVGFGLGFYTRAEDELEEGFEDQGFDVSVDLEPAYGLDLQVGYRFAEDFALQVHFQYMPDAKAEANSVEFLKADSWSLTGDFKSFLGGERIEPYFLVGFGVMELELKDTLDLGLRAKDDAFAVRFGGGVDFWVSDQLRWYIELGGIVPTGDLEKSDQFTFGTGIIF